MRAIVLKDAAFSWLRFDRQMHYVATEVGRWSSDLLGASREKSIEVEVKVSLSDLRVDFKKEKHGRYEKAYDSERQDHYKDVPNTFLFLVPAPLAAEAAKLCEELRPRYGVLSFDDEAPYPRDRLMLFRKAQKIHKAPPTEELLDTLAKRMASDLATHYFVAARHQGWMEEMRAEVRKISDQRRIEEESDA